MQPAGYRHSSYAEYTAFWSISLKKITVGDDVSMPVGGDHRTGNAGACALVYEIT